MNDKTLPQAVEKENIFFKIKKWIKSLIKKDENNMTNTTTIQSNIQEEKSFDETIRVVDKTEVLNLQKKLKENKIKISELTDNQLAEMIELYKSQIEQKKIKLKHYRQIINKKDFSSF